MHPKLSRKAKLVVTVLIVAYVLFPGELAMVPFMGPFAVFLLAEEAAMLIWLINAWFQKDTAGAVSYDG